MLQFRQAVEVFDARAVKLTRMTSPHRIEADVLLSIGAFYAIPRQNPRREGR